jgi:hypothetical protein
MENFTDFTDKYKCEKCVILCSRESEWIRHVQTKKHIGNANGNKHFTKKIYACKNIQPTTINTTNNNNKKTQLILFFLKNKIMYLMYSSASIVLQV